MRKYNFGAEPFAPFSNEALLSSICVNDLIPARQKPLYLSPPALEPVSLRRRNKRLHWLLIAVFMLGFGFQRPINAPTPHLQRR